VAKVQLAASSSSSAPALSNAEGKAGLMLRQSNEVSSPFVFVYVQNGKVMVEYRDAVTNQVVTLEGGVLSSVTEAKYLKLERKEGSVYVFESGDSLTWRQITVLTLALTGSVNVGLVSDITNGFVQTIFDSVLVQAQEQPVQNEIVIEKVIDSTQKDVMGHRFYKEPGLNARGDAVVIFDTGVLESGTNVKVTISQTPAKNYPDIPGFEKSYPSDKVKNVGPSLTVELPLSKLNWQGEDEARMMSIVPSFYKGTLDTVATKDVFLEVRMLRADGTLVFFTFDYGFRGEVDISNLFLQANLGGSVPETLKISVQAVDLSQVLPGGSPSGPVNQLQQQSYEDVLTAQADKTDAPVLPNFLTGLYHIDVDAVEAASTFSSCTSEKGMTTQNLPSAFTRVTVKTS
jgi:hypothetical protein